MAAMLTGCGPAYEHPATGNVAATMRRANFDPSRCHEEGPAVYWCDNDQATNTMPAPENQTNDSRVFKLPGICPPGARWNLNKGCVDVDTGAPVTN